MKPEIELVSTGSELLNGRTVNAHAQTLARHLADLGLRLTRDTTVPDDLGAIEDAVRGALERVDVVVVTGGLGPTSDDVTREAVARIVGVRLVVHEPSRAAIRDRYARTKRQLNASVERHALVLDTADILVNSVGLAPGEEIRTGGKLVYLLPGPPHEFLAVLREQVLPRLARLALAANPHLRVFQICGIGESDIVSRLMNDPFPGPGVEVAYCANIGRIEVRLWAAVDALAALDRASARLRERVGEHVYAEADTTLEEVVGRFCREQGRTLAVAESCTGGLVAHRLTNVSGSSDYFLGGEVAYANEAKVRDLGVRPATLESAGAVSGEVAGQMAEGARRRFGADVGVGVTGIAGPTGGTAAKPVGLVYVAVADAAGTVVKEHRFAGTRAIIKEWSAQMALDFLRRRLAGQVQP